MKALGAPGQRIFAWYRVIYVACIGVMSIQTMTRARSVTDHHFWLAGIEVIGALLLLSRRTQRVGLVALLIVYAAAALHAVVAGEVPLSLVLFAASAAIIVYADPERAAAA